MKIAILGFGVVGRGVYDIVKNDLPHQIQTKYVLDIRPIDGIDCQRAQSIDQILNDPEVDLVVEAMGGLHPAYEFVAAALSAGKHCVTPNKQLVSSMFSELHKAAEAKGVCFLYTPSAGGGIPWLYNLCRTKRCGAIDAFRGIINGTTNYILDAMEKNGADFGATLAKAQELGYAEANPSADIDGTDVQRKCAISANLAFDVCVDPQEIPTAGIRHITGADIRAFSEKGLVCKLLCNGSRSTSGSVCAYVEPALMPLRSLEANVAENFNMVSLWGKHVGMLSFYGQGAGRYPTAHSLVEDILDVYTGAASVKRSTVPCPLNNSVIQHRYYVRGTDVGAFDDIKDSRMGDGILTKTISVAQMHQRAARSKESGIELFFAGIPE